MFSALAGVLGYGLLRQGWILRSAAQVEVSGSTQVSRDQVIQAARLQFPLPLLGLQPRALDQTLRDALPVEGVRVTRLMLPPRLRIELRDREAVARAERRTDRGLESGYVDARGNWIANRQEQGVRVKGSSSLRVIGWNERHRATLSQVLGARQQLGPGLQTIRFDPDGSLWLTTGELGEVRLGPSDSRLSRRLEVVQVLRSSLPAQMAGRKPLLIDLSDPEQPELSLPGSAATATAAGPVPSAVPRGAQ